MALSSEHNKRPFATRPKSLDKPEKVHDLIWRQWPPEGYCQQVNRVLHNKNGGQDSQPQETRTT